jgi:hypothetical protein
MENLRKQPFLLSMQQAVNQTSDLEGYRTLLSEQQDAFKEYLDEHFNSEKPAPKRFRFLKRAEYELCRIREKDADKIMENDEIFYRFWVMIIEDTLRFILIGTKSLEFQSNCPAHMLSEPVQSFPACIWSVNKIDLMELMVGVYQIDAIRLQDGSRPSFPLFVQAVGNVFGIEFDDPKKEAHRVVTRKKNPTPFFDRIVTLLKNKNHQLSM